jgi:serine phosphatase RsbU (regulator of sigma subunit)
MDKLKFTIAKKLYLAFLGLTLSSVIGYGFLSYDDLSEQRRKDILESLRISNRSLAESYEKDIFRIKEKCLFFVNKLLSSDSKLRDFEKNLGLQQITLFEVSQGALTPRLHWMSQNHTKNLSSSQMMKTLVKASMEQDFVVKQLEDEHWALAFPLSVEGKNLYSYTIVDSTLFGRKLLHSGLGQNFYVMNYSESPEITGDDRGLSELLSHMDLIKEKKQNGVFRVSEDLFVARSSLSNGDWVLSTVSRQSIQSALNFFFVKAFLFLLLIMTAVPVISILISYTLTKRIRELADLAQETAQGNFKVRVQQTGSDEVGDLARNFNFMNEKVEELIEETAEKARMEGELTIARTVQSSLLPESGYKDDQIEIVGFYQSASECGGDLWSFKKKNNQLFFCIGDATGHGVAPALVTSAANSVIALIDDMENPTVEQIVRQLNKVIFQTSKGHINMTFFTAQIDLDTLEMTYCCSSHDPPLVVSQDREEEVFLNEKLSRRLGEIEEYEASICHFQLQKKDRILCYTDGITELVNNRGRQYGLRKLTKIWKTLDEENLTAQDRIQRLYRDIEKHQGDMPQDDDITYCIVEIA